MQTRRRAHRSPAALIRLLFVTLAAPTAANAQSMQALMISGAWTRVDSARSLQTPLPTGALGTQLSIQTNYVAPSLLTFIEASLIGKAPTGTIQLATMPATGSVTLLKVDGTRLQSVDLPAADASKTTPTLLGVKFTSSVFASGSAAWPFVEPDPREQIQHACGSRRI